MLNQRRREVSDQEVAADRHHQEAAMVVLLEAIAPALAPAEGLTQEPVPQDTTGRSLTLGTIMLTIFQRAL